MTDRMTDEQLAEIWDWFCEWASQGPYEDNFSALYQELKAERQRVKELEAAVQQKIGLVEAEMACAEGFFQRAEAAEARLAAIAGLVEKWRTAAERFKWANDAPTYGHCADELEALINPPVSTPSEPPA